MEEYGYIENGCLHSKRIEPITENYKDNDGNIKTRIITIQAQIDNLGSLWKPVDPVDENKLQTEDGYIICLEPYDTGDRISYNYIKQFDSQKINKQIQELKQALSDSDYKITKCYEANLLGEKLPYDMATLHTEREAQRAKINELEAKL